MIYRIEYIVRMILISSMVSGAFMCLMTESGMEKSTNDPSGDGAVEPVEIKVGSRTIVTDQFTPAGTPVVPMWKAAMADTNLRRGAGFPILENAEHSIVWQPASLEEGAYNHYACLIQFNGVFYAMWGNHPNGEDAPGQRVLYSVSKEWGVWSDARELLSPPGPVLPRSEKGIHLKPDRWAVISGQLYAIVYAYGAGIYPIALKMNTDGKPGKPFLLNLLEEGNQLPEYMTEKNIPGEKKDIVQNLHNWYGETNQISWWAWTSDSWGVNRKAVDGANLIESFMYRAKDGTKVLMMRNWGTPRNPVHNNRMYVCFSDSQEHGWGQLYPTDIPDSPTRAQALTLDNGKVLLIGSQNVPYYDQALYLDRDPITVSVSDDGYFFDRVFALRTESPKGFRFSGVSGRNPGYAYSSSVVYDGWLYTLYSIGKEDMGISRVPLSELGI